MEEKLSNIWKPANELRGFQIFDFTIILLIFGFLLSFFEPRYLLSPTVTTGGDTGSHYNTAVYLKEVLLPKGKIMGWMPGNYAGFPLFYHYFPLPFILMVLLSFVIPLTVAFKLISVLGIFLLPVCVYAAFRLLKYDFPIPISGALLTLPFLFMEANSMWGANIPSTLAGEFSYGIGISLAFLFFGTLHAGIENKKLIILNAILILLIGLSHGYTLILAGIIGSYFLFTRKTFLENLKYLFFVFGLGVLLLGFWLIPFIGTLPYVTEYVTRWHIGSIFEVLPRILIPGVALSAAALIANFSEPRTKYFLYNIAVCLILYLIGPRVGVLDIRFIPILQIFLSIFGATFLLSLLKEIKLKPALPAITLILVLLWTAANVTYIRSWISWNYTGFEGKKSWPLFRQINDYLRATDGGRVVYEHSPLHNTFGTERAFESLPLFAKRNTLEGLYMQSSISSPFVFYIQSEISKVCSGPFPQYTYTHLDLRSALPHLKMFNVSHYIARTPEAKKAAAAIPELKLEKTFDDYQIYRLTTNDGHYVVPLAREPVRLKTANWKKDFFEWFKDRNLDRFPHLIIDDPKRSPLTPLPSSAAVRSENITEEEIEFDTDLIGFPHLIKVSYHPNWQVEGADRIYLVSPSFMLVYPNEKHVRLYFGKNVFNYVGKGLTLAGMALILISGIIPLTHGRQT